VPVPCGAAPGSPDAAQKFPFPGETNPAAPSLSGVPQSPPDAPAAASSANSTAGATKAAKQFPFPGDADASGSPDASSSSSSSSSSDASAADANPDPALKDQGSEGAAPGRHLLHRVNPVGTKLQSDDEREAEDLDIARFYTETGDLQGAYMRSHDAVKLAPDDADAHFLLAETAAKMNKRDEAIAEYNACLKLDPVEKEAKAARKALERLKP
jgi:tetratricopeptide (TPR) repeat protein